MLNASDMVVSRTVLNSILYTYDAKGRLTRKKIVPASGTAQTYYYEYAEDKSMTASFNIGTQKIFSHSKSDSFGRKVFDELQLGSGVLSRQFAYLHGEVTEQHQDNSKLKSSPTTNLVQSISLSGNRKLEYEYDGEERITKVTDSQYNNSGVVTGSEVTSYVYDAIGQLARVTYPNATTTAYTYDNYGNILAKGDYDGNGGILDNANKRTYTYGNTSWKDQLTAYNGQTILYDAGGNPTSYLGHTMVWEKGRQLQYFDQNSYTYNANGIRTSKTIGDTTHFYTLEGTKILREDYCGSTLIPLYDNSDEVCGIQFNGSPYFFQKNLQGDVIAITNASGVVTGKYEYDAWGKILSITDQNGIDISSNVFHIANINPFRYRSYYYDTEIGMYYLQSRYYDPEVGRFVNGDDANIVGTEEQIICENLFCYCKNETTNQIDSNGHFSLPFISTKIINPMYVDPRISKARDNYKHNKSLTAPHGYINGQRRFSNFKFGCFDLGYMGCEIIAIFNLLTFLRKSPSLADLIYTFELGLYDYGAFGSLGLNPFSLGSYFKSQGIKYKLFTKQNDFESAVKKNYSFIISFWNDKDDIPMSELHTVFGYYILDHYVIFNYEAQYETRYAVLSNHFKDVLKNGKFVTGYYFTGRQYKW